tara:strand:+ start:67 stop:1728 length:1662 start_codon:yes stop_codon:yes gene_type:complete
MGILSDFLLSPVGQVGYGAAAEIYDEINIKAGDQQRLFQGLGEDLRGERNKNSALLNQKLSNFKTLEAEFLNSPELFFPDASTEASTDDLKKLFAPMANFLKGDTFVGKPAEVRLKVLQAMHSSGGFEKGAEYTPVGEFEAKSRAAIAGPLRTYSGLGWNTFQNQVGDGLDYKTPEFDITGTVDDALILTAFNFPFFTEGLFAVENRDVLDMARITLLNYNQRKKAEDMSGGMHGNYFLSNYNDLREKEMTKIQNSKNPIDVAGLAFRFGLDETGFRQLTTTDSPHLAGLTQILARIKGLKPDEIGGADFTDLANKSKELLVAHFGYIKDIQEAVGDKSYTEFPPDAKAMSIAVKTHIENIVNNVGGNKENSLEIAKNHNQLLTSNGASGFGIYLNADSGDKGRVEESFTFMLVPDPDKKFSPEEGKPVTQPMKWIVMSSTGVMFELPGKLALQYIQDENYFGYRQDLANNVMFNPETQREELKEHLRLIIKAAMENKIKLNIANPKWVEYLEEKGIFGRDPITGTNLKYFGKTSWVKPGDTGVITEDTGIVN